MAGDLPIVVVGGGHNGLVAACYLAQAGRSVVVLEALDRAGGGARTEETIPGYRFDLHSVAHNIINMTDIPAELDLAGAGLRYQEMDPFSVAVHADGRRVRFWRDIDATVASIAEVDRAEADAYRRFMDVAVPVIETVMPSIQGKSLAAGLGGRARQMLRVARTGPMARAADLMGSYRALLERWLPSDLTRGPVAAFAAHAGVGPEVAGGSLFAFWQAAYHLHGQWHAEGGAQGLTDALLRRAEGLGVEVRLRAPVTAIDTSGGAVRGVRLGGGERVAATAVITAIDPKVALLDLPDPPVAPPDRADLSAARRGNVVQAVIHVATDRLPPYADSRAGDWNGLQSYVDHLDHLVNGWTAAEAGLLPDPLPLYGFTSTALDPGLAREGGHTVYLACPTAPADVQGGWPNRCDEFVESALATVERHAPGFRESVRDVVTRTPADMAAEGWIGAHPMHLDLALDQLGPFRPTRRLADHRTPVPGLYLSGAGTAPTGGIAGTPGKLAARALLQDQSVRTHKRHR